MRLHAETPPVAQFAPLQTIPGMGILPPLDALPGSHAGAVKFVPMGKFFAVPQACSSRFLLRPRVHGLSGSMNGMFAPESCPFIVSNINRYLTTIIDPTETFTELSLRFISATQSVCYL